MINLLKVGKCFGTAETESLLPSSSQQKIQGEGTKYTNTKSTWQKTISTI